MNNDIENDFSPQQSLQLIESMINRAKDKYAEMVICILFGAGWFLDAAFYSFC